MHKAECGMHKAGCKPVADSSSCNKGQSILSLTEPFFYTEMQQ